MGRFINRVGFTLVELIIALSILILVGGVGSQVDLVDLLDNEKYLTDNGLELDTQSLIAGLEANSKEPSVNDQTIPPMNPAPTRIKTQPKKLSDPGSAPSKIAVNAASTISSQWIRRLHG